MSELKKITAIVKNYEHHFSQEAGNLYKKVRLQDEAGKTFYYKDLIMPSYLERQGALIRDVPRTWFLKHIGKSAVVVVAYEKKDGTIEYDLDEVRSLARSGLFMGIVYGILSIPCGIVAGIGTYGIGLLLIPVFLHFSYKQIFKIPKSLSRKQILEDLSHHGITVGEGWSR